MEDLIKKILSEHVNNKIYINEMAKQDWCKSRWSSIYPEYHFCVAAENYIKNELEDEKSEGRRRRGKKIFKEFEDEMVKFYNSNLEYEGLNNRITRITNKSPIFVEGKSEVDDANEKLYSNCPKFMNVVNKHIEEFDKKVKLYYKEDDKYSIENRLSTNYSALSVLFTKFFEHKGAFDDVQVKNIDWEKISKNWITHLFHPNTKFEDIRPDEKKNDNRYRLSSLNFKELADIYFKGSVLFDSSDIKKSVKDVLEKVRGKGFETEDVFESKYLKNKYEYIRYAKDYGFVDMFGGVDFMIKGNNNMWYPIQVKTTATEPTYKISTLGCQVYYIVEKRAKNEFKIIKHSTPSEDAFGI
jgi:hypothetical protein